MCYIALYAVHHVPGAEITYWFSLSQKIFGTNVIKWLIVSVIYQATCKTATLCSHFCLISFNIVWLVAFDIRYFLFFPLHIMQTVTTVHTTPQFTIYGQRYQASPLNLWIQVSSVSLPEYKIKHLDMLSGFQNLCERIGLFKQRVWVCYCDTMPSLQQVDFKSNLKTWPWVFLSLHDNTLDQLIKLDIASYIS